MIILLKIAKEFGKFICRKRASYLSKKLIQLIDVLKNNIENVNFNPKTNGEEELLRKLTAFKLKTILDVGANIGEWAQMASQIFQEAKIYSFEILPRHWDVFNLKTSDYKNIILNKFGLSDFEGSIDVYYNSNTETDASATIYPKFLIEAETKYYTSKETCLVKKASQFVLDNNINAIDFLKIDVEGHELSVIKGFGDFMQHVRIIQFEYGVYDITSKTLLCDFFEYLKKYDFRIGKLYPRSVEFFEYTYFKENFLGCNYIAVKKNDTNLINLISKF